MDKPMLLTELKAMIASVPNFATYSPTSEEHRIWIGRARALLASWNNLAAISFDLDVPGLSSPLLKDRSLGNLLQVLYNAIGALELDVQELPPQAFGPGAVYDFMRKLRDLLSSAAKSVFIVDPYLDDEIFDAYLTSIKSGVAVRLLVNQYASSIKHSLGKFVAQYKMDVECRESKNLHDRVIFVDGHSCWVCGQSIKDAAKTKPTYLAPLPGDVAQMKLGHYENIWQHADLV